MVDDDPQICGLLQRGLSYEGFKVEVAIDGPEAITRARDHGPDLVILDILLPGMDGFEVARRLKRGSNAPVLMLTAKGTTLDKVAGFNAGADDYVVKPFDFDELVVRVRALLRRSQPEQGELLRFHNIVMDTGSRQVTCGGAAIEFSVREFELLEFFLRNPRKVLTRTAIYEKVWGFDYGHDSNVIEVYVRYLRSKIEAIGQPSPIHTVRGVGYVLRE